MAVKKAEPFTAHEVSDPEVREVVAVEPSMKASVPFAEDFCRYRGTGPSKLQLLNDAGFDSWEDIANPEKRDQLLAIAGISTSMVMLLIDIAKEKV